MSLRFFYFIIFIVALFLLAPHQIFACTCFHRSDPPCVAYGKATAIFDGTVIDVKKIPRITYLARRVKLKVANFYKGTEQKIIYIYTGDGRTDCGYKFRIGKRYLIYANDHEQGLFTDNCSRTREIEDAEEDKDYFRQSANGLRIFGTVEKYDPKENLNNPRNEIFPNVLIQIKGAQNHEIKTDASGKYEFLKLPPGKYEIKALVPENYKVSYPSNHSRLAVYSLEASNKGCYEANFIFEPK